MSITHYGSFCNRLSRIWAKKETAAQISRSLCRTIYQFAFSKIQYPVFSCAYKSS